MAGSEWHSSLRPGSVGPNIGLVSIDRASVVAVVAAGIAADPGGDHSVPVLARRAGVSPRHLGRLFARHLQCPPGRFVELVRVDVARRLLAIGDEPITTIGRQVGFASPETMRRAFVRIVGVPPRVYRRQTRVAARGPMAGSEGSVSLPFPRRGPTIDACSPSPEPAGG
jgi:AraC-like DNA-binding protein